MLGISKFLQLTFYSNFQFIISYFSGFFLLRTPPTAVVCVPIVVGVPQFDKPCFTGLVEWNIRQLFAIFYISMVP
jgi:hypothetical protein